MYVLVFIPCVHSLNLIAFIIGLEIADGKSRMGNRGWEIADGKSRMGSPPPPFFFFFLVRGGSALKGLRAYFFFHK